MYKVHYSKFGPNEQVKKGYLESQARRGEIMKFFTLDTVWERTTTAVTDIRSAPSFGQNCFIATTESGSKYLIWID